MFEMIRTIIKNLFDGPATRMYPMEKREPFANARGQITGIDGDACIYCGICQRKCPALAIVVDKPMKTWTLDPYKCVICGVCQEACPKKCITGSGQYRAPEYQKQHITVTQSAPATVEAPTVSEA